MYESHHCNSSTLFWCWTEGIIIHLVYSIFFFTEIIWRTNCDLYWEIEWSVIGVQFHGVLGLVGIDVLNQKWSVSANDNSVPIAILQLELLVKWKAGFHRDKKQHFIDESTLFSRMSLYKFFERCATWHPVDIVSIPRLQGCMGGGCGQRASRIL